MSCRNAATILAREFEWLEALKDWDREDCSFAEYLDIMHVPEASRKRLIGFVEGFNAADHRVIGVAALAKQQAIEDATEGDRMFHVRGGYAQVPEFLAQQIREHGGTILHGNSRDRDSMEAGKCRSRLPARREIRDAPRHRRCHRAATGCAAIGRTGNLPVATARHAARVADSCRPCSPHGLDLSPQILDAISPLDRPPTISMN